MTTPTSEAARRAVQRRLIAELVGLILLVAGAAGVVAAGFAWDWRIGVSVLSAFAMAAGFTLSSRKV